LENCTGLLLAINFTLELLNNAADIKLKYAEFLNLGVDKSMMHPVDPIIKKRVDDGLEELRKKILSDPRFRPGASAPEEVSTLDEALKILLDKIQHSFTFDVTAIPPPKEKESTQERIEIESSYGEIRRLSVEIKKLKPPAQPVIALPIPD
jgi:hypothetical protein